MRPELWTQSASDEEIVSQILDEVRVPRDEPDG
jgi:hypothetical protein